MARARFLFVVAVLAGFAWAVPSRAGAESSPYRLHVQGHLGASSGSLDIDVPWDASKNGSPFDFTAEDGDDISLMHLRWAWQQLKLVPEGRKVTFETDKESIRASRSGGYLVLEPRPLDDRDDRHTRIKIPDYIVETILQSNGRLTDRDLERLARQHGRVTLVKINSDAGGASVWLDRAGERSD
jgi:hypothetical protein